MSLPAAIAQALAPFAPPASTQDNFQLLLDRRKLAQDKLDSM